MNSIKDNSDGVENKRKYYENITPHKIAVLIFIREYCNLIQKWLGARMAMKSLTFTVQWLAEICKTLLMSKNLKNNQAITFTLAKQCQYSCPKYRRGFNMLILKLMQCPDMQFREFCTLLTVNESKLHPKHIELFHKEINNIYQNNVETLLDISLMLDRLIVDPLNSTATCIINRSSCIGLYLRRIILALDRLSFHKVIELKRAFESYINYASKEQLIDQIDAMDMDYDHNTLDADNHINNCRDKVMWSRRQSDLFLAQQSNLMLHNEKEALDPKIIKNTVEELISYDKDYAEAHYLNYLNCLRVREFCGAMNSLYHCFDRGAVNEDRVRETRGFRYSALNLAMLHADFNHRDETLDAIKECIMLAQECNDNVCLQLALVCLAQHNYLDVSKTHGNLLQKAVARCLDLSLSQTASLAMQCRVQNMALSGSMPYALMEVMRRSDLLNCQNSMVDLMSNSYSQKTALWQLYGKTDMANIFAQLLLHLNTSYMTQGNYPYNGEGTCIAICKASSGLPYNLANCVLDHARERCPREPLTKNWMFMQYILSFSYLMHQDKWQDAGLCANQMAALNVWECLLMKGRLNIFYGDVISANFCVNSVIDHSDKDKELKNIINCRIRALCMSAQTDRNVYCTVGETIANLNLALVLSSNNYLDYNSAMIELHIAHLQMDMGLPNQALKLINKSLPCVLTNGDNFDIARALLLFVKCTVSSVNMKETEDKYDTILKCATMLNKVRHYLQLDEAHSKIKDVLHFQAILYDQINLIGERNKCSHEYRILEEQYNICDGYNMLTCF